MADAAEAETYQTFDASVYTYGAELIETANKIGTPGKGILAADESTGTIGKRLAGINVENTEDNRRAYRQLLFKTEGWGDFCSGVILYEETLYQKDDDGKDFVDIIKEAGVVPGIKVDMGTRELPFFPGDKYTQGLTNLDERAKRYYEKGARFAKWRCVLKIQNDTISETSIKEVAWTLARYAAICQNNGLCPIVEPEILMDGPHTLETSQKCTEKVLAACYKALSDQRVLLEGSLLKPNMCHAGSDCAKSYSYADNGLATVTALKRTVPSAVPAICFLSGGQSEKEATNNLNEINKILNATVRPWSCTFSYGRALQKSVLAAWQGSADNIKEAQKALMIRAQFNGAASKGEYNPEEDTDENAAKSLYQKGYTY